MNKDKKILFSWKRIIAVFMLFTMLAASIAGVSQYFGPVAVRAENAVATGHVNSGVSGLRVRTQPDTQTRSEERRVGKECRSRWSPYH